MIDIKNVSYCYDEKKDSALKNINLKITKGECVLLCGKSGCGKTTITKSINGLIPHFFEKGRLDGDIMINGMNTKNIEMYQLAKIVGSVFQNPKSQFFYLDSDSELVFSMENAGVSQDNIKKNKAQTIEDLKIQNLMNRNVFHMSGGEKQSLAFASSYISSPDVLVLDEPSANLDKQSIIRLKDLLVIAKEKGKTIIIAEHRLWFLKEIVDRAFYIDNGMIIEEFSGEDFFNLDETIRKKYSLRELHYKQQEKSLISKDGDLVAKGISYSIKGSKIIDELSFGINKGEVLGIVGENGSGKSTLIKILSGLIKTKQARIIFDDKSLKVKDLRKLVYLVMQDVNHQLFTESVIAECRLANQSTDEEIRQVLKELNLYDFQDTHPMALSGGQKQRLAIISAVLSNKPILIFDEPTSGLDSLHMYVFSKIINSLKAKGKIIIIVSHDNELLGYCADRILRLDSELYEKYSAKCKYGNGSE